MTEICPHCDCEYGWPHSCHESMQARIKALAVDRADIARDLHDVEVKNMVLCERILALEAALRDTLSGNYPTPARYDEIRALVATAETKGES